MKKVLFMSILITLFTCFISVDAMTEAELRKRFDEVIVSENGSFKVADGDKKAIDDYLAKYELSEADCDYISSQIDKAINIIKAEGKTEFKDFSASAKSQLKTLVANVNANTAVNATVTDGEVVILNNDGTTFYTADKLVKQTGSENSKIAIIAGASFVITLVGACLVIRQVKNSNN